jgi:hypothetical protein
MLRESWNSRKIRRTIWLRNVLLQNPFRKLKLPRQQRLPMMFMSGAAAMMSGRQDQTVRVI